MGLLDVPPGAIVKERKGTKNYRCCECNELIRSDLGETHAEQMIPSEIQQVGGFTIQGKRQRVRYHIICPPKEN